MIVKSFYLEFSTARADIIKKHVIECIKKHGSVYGDFVLSKFDDPFLEEHVNSIAICDTDITFHEQQVDHFYSLYHNCLIIQ